MRVGIDVTPTISGLTGVSRYTESLVRGLRDAGVDVVPFAIGRGPGTLPSGSRHLRIPLRVVQRAWQLGLPLRAEHLSGPVDVVHSTDLVLPPTRKPLVATVHDAAALEMPELHSSGAVHQTQRRIASLHRATVVIANSQATADAINQFASGIRELVVVPLAPYPMPDPVGDPSVDRPFLLCVGEVAVRKDHLTLVRAFAKAQVGDHRLVIAGPRGPATAPLEDEIRKLGLSERVILTGLIDDATLAGLYSAATALCLTSRQEGFGMPLVEAMQRGLPIVASDLPAVREVTGPAAVLVPPADVTGFAAAFENLIADNDLRERLIRAGRDQASGFTLAGTVAGTVAAYERAVSLA